MGLTKVTYNMIATAPANVTDFGAVGDNVTNDTAAINAAISAINAGQYKALYFPAGFYKINGALTTITANQIVVYGEGPRQSVLSQSANTNTFVFSPTDPTTQFIQDVTFMNLGVDQGATTSPTAGVALSITKLTRGYFVNFDVRNVFQGVVIEGSNDIHFDTFTLTSASTWATVAADSFLFKIKKYSTTTASSELFLSNFNIKGVGDFGDPNTLDTCFIVEQCDGLFASTGHCGFSHNAVLFINPQNDATGDIQNLEFSNIYFDGNGAGSTTNSCILIDGSTTPFVTHVKFDGCAIKNYLGNGINANLQKIYDLRITNSMISDCGAFPMIFSETNEFIFANNTVSRNNINNTTNNAITLLAAVRGVIANNMIVAGTNPHNRGIYIVTNSSDINVSNNVLQGHTTDIDVSTGNARITFSSNRKAGSNPTVVAADPLVFPVGYDTVTVTGNTNFSSINLPNIADVVVTFRFTGTPTVFDGAGNISLTSNFAATANSTLTLLNTGSGWTEVSRAVV
jgi:hypothetical protein